jgi:RNA polymerase sigma factor (TIGR02999 family)
VTEPSLFTRLLRRGAEGDAEADRDLLPLVYGELKRLAGSFMRGQGADHTLQATALVHEAWMKLVDGPGRESWESRRHFFAVAASAMRSVLVDHARARRALKRGGTDRGRVPLDDVVDRAEESVRDVLEFDDALETLAGTDPDLAKLVELRFYAGLTMEEAAGALGVSKPTAERRWSVARALLWERLKDGGEGG